MLKFYVALLTVVFSLNATAEGIRCEFRENDVDGSGWVYYTLEVKADNNGKYTSRFEEQIQYSTGPLETWEMEISDARCRFSPKDALISECSGEIDSWPGLIHVSHTMSVSNEHISVWASRLTSLEDGAGAYDNKEFSFEPWNCVAL